MAAFVPVGQVAFAGSRWGSPFGVLTCALEVVRSGHSVSVGCQRGVDSVVRSAVPSASLTVFEYLAPEFSHLPVQAALAARTRACVLSANCLLAFAPESGVLGRGTSLAVSTAVAAGLPVFVVSPTAPAGAGWVQSSFAGVSGWSFMPSQTALF